MYTQWLTESAGLKSCICCSFVAVDPCTEFTSSSPVDAQGHVYITGDQFVQDVDQTDKVLPVGFLYCDTDIDGQTPVYGDYWTQWDV